jgi:hypothetical protein
LHEHRADVESDLSVFHRIDDPGSLHPQRLIDLVVRLGFYPGVVQARLRAETAAEDAALPPAYDLGSDRVVDSSPGSLGADPILGGVIELG